MDERGYGARVIATPVNPQPGELWKVSLDPTVGRELQKTREGIVLGIQATMGLEVRLVVLASEWNPNHRKYAWRVKLEPTGMNGLSKPVAVQPEQTRCLSLERFTAPMGRLSAEEYAEVKDAMALFLGID